MYTYSIPINNDHFERSGRDRVVAALKQAGITRAFLATGALTTDETENKRVISLLRENLAYLKKEGFEAGVWYWAFMCDDGGRFTKITGVNGHPSATECCPSDPEFRRFAADFTQRVAELGPDIILLDDDLRYGHLDSGLSCFCEHHMADICARVGETLTRDELKEKIFTGGKNKYRDAYMDSLGDAMRLYAAALREAIDTVDPRIRLGQCSCITCWDQEGVTSPEMSKIFAGSTRPFLRTIGAPYWAPPKNWGNRLGDVIDINRREIRTAHEYDPDIEVIGEGDVWPRPRYITPASYLELFDLALIADGGADGMHKYMLDYYSAASDYDPGYLERHNDNAGDREKIHGMFDGKTPVGVHVWSTERKFADYDLPETFVGEDFIQNMLFSRAYRFVTGCSLPMTLDEGVSGLAFGEDAKKLPEEALGKPLIIDLHAARILAGKGIDTGISDFGERIHPSYQHFIEADDYTKTDFGLNAYGITIKETASVLAEYDNGIPSAFEYTNADGNSFLVLNFRADLDDERFWRNYRLQKIVTDFAKPPVSLTGEPDLYIIASAKGNRLSVLLLNASADKIPHPAVSVPDGKPVGFVNCSGELKDGKMQLTTLHAFDHAAFEIELDEGEINFR